MTHDENKTVNISNMTLDQLRQLLNDYDFDEMYYIRIIKRINQLVILEEMQRISPQFDDNTVQHVNERTKQQIINQELQNLMPDFEAIKQLEFKEKQQLTMQILNLKYDVSQYDDIQVLETLQQKQKDKNGVIKFDGPQNQALVQYHLASILKYYKGMIIRVYFKDQDNNMSIQIYTIKDRLIQSIQQAVFKGVQNEIEHTGSDMLLEYQMLHAYKIEILSMIDVKNKNTLQQNDVQMDELDKNMKMKRDNYLKLKQGDYKQLVLDGQIEPKKKTNKKNKGAYFNFINKIPQIDLSRYQIGNNLEQHLQLSRQQQCFIYALQKSEKYNDQEIQAILSQIPQNLQLFSLSQIKNIKHIGPITIHYYEKEDSDSRKMIIKGDKDDERQYKKEPIHLCLFKEHYFIYDTDLEISNFWLNNYEQYKNNEKFLDNTNVCQIRGNCFRKSKNLNDSLSVIKLMFELNMFEEIKDYNEFNYKQNSKQVISAPANAEDYCLLSNQSRIHQEAFEQLQEDPQNQDAKNKYNEGIKHHDFNKILFADTEAFTIDDEGKFINHECYLCVWADGDIYESSKDVNGLIRYIYKLYENDEYEKTKFNKPQSSVLVYFHNLSYDCQFIIKEKYEINDVIQNNGKMLQFSITLANRQGAKVKIVFRDSYIMISEKLSELPKMFLSKQEQETIQKEVMCYNYYTKSRYLDNIGDIDEALQFITMKDVIDVKQEFIEALKKSNCMIEDKSFDMQKYALFYCEQDVRVLQKCVQKFAELLLENLEMDMYSYISISSLALAYQVKNHCFDNCYQVTGLLRQFLQQFVIGGRCMTSENKKQVMGNLYTNKAVKRLKLQDFDAVSLYPSAMTRTYYPAGKLQTLTPEMIQHYNVRENLFQIKEEKTSTDYHTLFLEVKLFKGDDFIKRDFPLLSQKIDGVRQFTNKICEENRYFLDTIGLQELVLRQNFKYEIISGVYTEKRDYTIQKIIKFMFDERVKCKEADNPLQAVYKLMMNSSYGKTIEGDRNETIEIYEESQIEKLYNKYDQINSVQQYGDKFCVKLEKECCEQTGYHHIGIQILSMSKRIMNEVMALAEDEKIKIYYQDTDSMQLKGNDLVKLNKKFKAKYDRELIGKKMGQFHSDFKSKKGKVQYGAYGVYISKKVYCVKLRVQDKKEKFCYDYHIRMKGVTSECITQKADELYGGDVIKLYQDLANGKAIEFDLCNAKVFMKKQDDYSYVNLSEFKRTLQFLTKEEKEQKKEEEKEEKKKKREEEKKNKK
ncbi:DNA_polymerase [Hexamita inflata]|uniref:DNA-directed DNA polymerase n=1 Tax=Hexamita inflata TaxID=28002 RepID=A0AA86UG07_9EUKA|nr:DNA polymerase [Hexamita inflata]